MTSEHEKLRAVFLASLMFLWLFAGTVAFAGGAGATVSSIGNVNAEDVPQSNSVEQAVTLTNVQNDGSEDTIVLAINPIEIKPTDVSITNSGDFNQATAEIADGAAQVTVESSATSDITLDVTLEPTDGDELPSDEYTYNVNADDGDGSASDTFEVTSTIDGNVVNVDQQTGFDEIQPALEQANTGETIKVAEGTYEEGQITADTADVTLRSIGDTDETTIVNDQNDASETIQIRESGITVDGFTVERTTTDDAPAQGIGVRATAGGDPVEIINNVVEGDSDNSAEEDSNFGIYVANDDATDVDNVEIRDNTVSDFSVGVQITVDQDQTVEGITVEDGNVIENNGYGVFISSFGDGAEGGDGPQDITIQGNTIQDNTAGENDESGVFVPSGNEEFFGAEKNDIDLSGITITSNNLINNGVQAVDSSGSSTLDATENWWGTASGPFTAETTASDPSGYVEGNVDVTPWLNDEAGDGEPTATAFFAGAAEDEYFESITAAVDAADGSESIKVGVDTVTESVKMDTQDVTLTSADEESQSKIEYVGDGNEGTPTINVVADGVTVENLDIERSVDSGDRDLQSSSAQGIAIRADNVVVRDNFVLNRDPPENNDKIDGILALNDNGGIENAVIEENSVQSFDGGIVVSAFFDGNDNTGASITDNTIQEGNAGVVIKEHDGNEGAVTGVSIERNQIDNTIDGLLLPGEGSQFQGFSYEDIDAAESIELVENNNIEFNNNGVTNQGTGTLDATENWWEDEDGPSGEGPGDGDSVSENVDFDPWLDAPAPDGEPVGETLEGSLTLNEQATDSSHAPFDERTGPAVILEDVSIDQQSDFIVTYSDGDDEIVAGSATSFDPDDVDGGQNGIVSVGIDDTEGFPGDHTAHVVPSDSSSGDYSPGDTISQATEDEILESDAATIFKGTLEFLDPTVEEPLSEDSEDFILGVADLDDGDGADSETQFTVDINPIDEDGNIVFDEFIGSSDVLTGLNDEVVVDIEQVPEDGDQNQLPIDAGEKDFFATIRIVNDDSTAGDAATPDEYPLLPNAEDGAFVDVGVTDDATVTIQEAPDAPAEPELTNLNIDGQDEDATIDEGENINDVEVEVENTGDEEGTFDITLEIAESGEDAEISETLSSTALEAGESINLEFTPDTSGLAPGQYDVNVADNEGISDASGTLSVLVDEVDVEIEHNPGSATSSIPIDDGRSFADQLDIFVDTEQEIQFGGDADHILRVVDPDTGDAVTYTPTDDARTVPLDEIRRLGVQNEGTGEPGDEILPFPFPESELGFENIDATVDGDTSIYTEDTFSEYVIELVDEDGTVIDSTDPRLVGMGYEATLDQDDQTAFVTRDPAVDEDWTVEFSLFEDEDPSLPPSEEVIDTIEITHSDDDDAFEIPLEQLDAEPDEYSWFLTIVDEDRAELDRERIVRISGSTDEGVLGPVTIEDTEDEVVDIEIEHDSSSGSARGGFGFFAEKLNVAPVSDENAPTVGGDADVTFEIENTDGDVVTVEPVDDAETVDATSIEFDIYGGTGELRDPPELVLSTDDVDDGFVRVDATVEGDTGMFADGVPDSTDEQSDPFDEYEVRLIDGDGATVDSTDQRLIGIGYNADDGIQQDGTTGEIQFIVPREDLNEGIDADWSAQFRLGSITDDEPGIGPVDVENNEGDEEFQFTVDVSEFPDGEYSASFELYSVADREAAAIGDFDDRVVNVFEVDNIVVGDGGPQVTFEADSPVSQNTQAGFSISIDQEVETADLEVRDDDDEVVFEQDATDALETGDGIVWDTTDQDGEVVDDGTYDAVLTVADEFGNEETATETIEVDNTPPEVELTVDDTALGSGDEVTVTADVTAQNSDIVEAQVGLVADFTDYTNTETFETDRELETTIQADDLADELSDGEFFAGAIAVDEAGNVERVDGANVTIDTSPPEVQLGVDDLGENEATLRIEADETVSLTDITVDAESDETDSDDPDRDVDGFDPATELDDAFEFTFDGDQVGDAEDTTFTVTVDAEDEVGNDDTYELTASVSGYEIEDGEAEVNPAAADGEFSLDVNEEETGDEARTASISQSSSPPAGTELSTVQVADQFIDVSDIGLEDDELEEATVRIPLDEVAVEGVDDDELSILFAEGDSEEYEELEPEIVDIEGDEFLEVDVDGFSQLAPGGVDDEPPTIDQTTADPGTQIDADVDSVAVTFDYSPVISDIDVAATTIDVLDISDDHTDVQITTGQATVEVSEFAPGESIDIELTVVDEAENEATDKVTISVDADLTSIDLALDETELEEGETTDATVEATFEDGATDDVTSTADISSTDPDIASVDGTTVTAEGTGTTEIEAEFESDGVTEIDGIEIDVEADSSEAGTGTGISTTGGSTVSDDDETVDPVTVPEEAVEVTESQTFVDADPERDGIQVAFEETASLKTLSFENEDLSDATTAAVTEAETLPAAVSEPSELTRSVIEINISAQAADEPATIEFELSSDEIEIEPANIAMQRYDDEADSWNELETSVVESTDDTVLFEAETPGFSLFAVTESESDLEAESTPEPEPEPEPEPTPEPEPEPTPEPEPEPDDQAGFGAVIAFIALLASALVAHRRR